MENKEIFLISFLKIDHVPNLVMIFSTWHRSNNNWLTQADSFWVMKYLPIVRARLQKHKKALEYFNSICQKKLDARKDNVKDSEDFIGLYLQELRQSDKLQDRLIVFVSVF